jgi:hypothetical protein
MPKLSDTQLVILNAACQRDDRMVLPLPKRMGGEKPNLAAGNSIKSMLKHGLVEEVDAELGDPVWHETGDGHGVTLVATGAALAALGIDTRAEMSGTVEPAKPAKKSRAAAKKPQKKQTKSTKGRKSQAKKKAPRAARTDSKQAQLIAMLKRAKGASIDEIVEAFDWQPHTVRGAIAGALKKKLGLDVTSEKDEKRGRVYSLKP